jgi:transposase-like protein
MPVMAVDNQNPHEQVGDYRSRPRWSAGKKLDAVLRLLRGEPLEVLSRELGVEAHRLAAWRDDFLEGGKEALKASGRTGHPTTEHSGRPSARSGS